jgi:uncharacterized protein
MLIEFTVGNFRSFREPQTLSLLAESLKAADREVDEANTFTAPNQVRLLRGALLYGPNASGKSNLVRALQVMRRLVLRSSGLQSSAATIEIEPFLLTTDTAEQPAFFEVVLFAGETETRYGFVATRTVVMGEWLFQRSSSRERTLFTREGDHFVIGDHFGEGVGLERRTRPDALFLSVVAGFNGPVASTVVNWFRKLSVRASLSTLAGRDQTMRAIDKGPFREAIVSLIQELDVGISGIRVDHEPVQPEFLEDSSGALIEFEGSNSVRIRRSRVRTIHRGFDADGLPAPDVEFDLARHESDGTKKVFALAGIFVEALSRGSVIVLDELDAQLHPHLTNALVRLFLSPRTNPGNSQLIFTTHDTHLLDRRLLRRDQLWIAEKTRIGATRLRSIAEFKGTRNDADYEDWYLEGRFGGVPHFGDPRRALIDAFETALRPRDSSEQEQQLELDQPTGPASARRIRGASETDL